jgi:hypothetical protein
VSALEAASAPLTPFHAPPHQPPLDQATRSFDGKRAVFDSCTWVSGLLTGFGSLTLGWRRRLIAQPCSTWPTTFTPVFVFAATFLMTQPLSHTATPVCPAIAHGPRWSLSQATPPELIVSRTRATLLKTDSPVETLCKLIQNAGHVSVLL